MKKILSVLILVFILTGCTLPIDMGPIGDPNSAFNNGVDNNSSTKIDQTQIDNLKQEILTELRQELINQYQSELSDAEKAVIAVGQLYENSVLGVSNFQTDSTGDLNEVGTGSGVIYKYDDVTKEYYLVTNYHVINGAVDVKVVLKDRTYINATVIGKDEKSDLAVLTFKSDLLLPQVTLGDSSQLVRGQYVVAIGNPLGYTYYGSITLGVVSSITKYMYLEETDQFSEWSTLIQHDAAINPGNSGGALFDIHGNLIGINNMKNIEENVSGIGFAIPINTVKRVIEKLETDYQMNWPVLGISGSNLNPGVKITNVDFKSPAYRAGILVNDIITEVNGIKIYNLYDLKAIILDSDFGDTLQITINRNGRIIEVNAVL